MRHSQAKLTHPPTDWDSYESHQNFVASPPYAPFEKHLLTLVDGPVSMRHANFSPHPPSSAISSTTSPVTEVLTAYFDSQDSSFAEKYAQFASALIDDGSCKAAAGGWVMEDVEHGSLGAGKKGKAFVACLGWDSKKAHMKARETPAFKNNIQLLRGPEVKALEVYHVAFTEK